MIVNTVVKQAAQVAVVTEIAVGDVYKRLETGGYGGPKVTLGLVTDVLQNGEKTAVTAVEFAPPEYSGSVEPKMVVLDGDSDAALYPVRKEEFIELMDALEKSQERVVEQAEYDLTRKSGILNRIRSMRQQGVTEAATRMVEAPR